MITTHSLVPRLNRAFPVYPTARGLDRLFADLWSGEPGATVAPVADFTPRMDIEETETSVTLRAELPGLEEKDFEVTLDADVLTVKGERRSEEVHEGDGFRHRETRSGKFARALRLPFEPSADSLKATYKAGILTIEVPKPEEARPQVRAIPVTSD